MNKILFPVTAAAILLLTTSCGEDKSGTSFEVTNANHDENVNPAHIRGYGSKSPGIPGAVPRPSQYYPLNTNTLPTETRQTLEGNVAVQMVTSYYSQSRTLNDLAKEHYPARASQSAPASGPATPSSNNNSGNNDGQTTGSNASQSNGANNATQTDGGSGNRTDQ